MQKQIVIILASLLIKTLGAGEPPPASPGNTRDMEQKAFIRRLQDRLGMRVTIPPMIKHKL